MNQLTRAKSRGEDSRSSGESLRGFESHTPALGEQSVTLRQIFESLLFLKR